MSRAAKSVFVFGVYMLLLGLTLILGPNLLLALFAVPPTDEVWIRIVGMLVIFLGLYYLQFARIDHSSLYRWTILLRSSVIVFFVAFVLLGLGPTPLILFGLVDLLGAAWTWMTLRSERAASATTRERFRPSI